MGATVDYRFSKRLAQWCLKSKWGPTKLKDQTGVAVGYWGLWLKAAEHHAAGKKVYASQAGPTVAQWQLIRDGMPGDFIEMMLDLMPDAPIRIGKKVCKHCEQRHDHPYLRAYCSVRCKADYFESQLWRHDAEWQRRHLPAARQPARKEQAG